MIVTSIRQAKQLVSHYPKLAVAINSLDEMIKRPFQPGTVTLSDDGLTTACFDRPSMRSRDRAMLEIHRRFIDIHVPLSNEESIGWAPLDALRHPFADYDEDKDIQFFNDAAQTIVRVRPGDIAVFFPDDAHGPNIGVGFHKKICIKIPVD